MLRVCLYCSESESDIASRWVHRESNLMFTLSSNKDQRKKFVFPFTFAECKWTLSVNKIASVRRIRRRLRDPGSSVFTSYCPLRLKGKERTALDTYVTHLKIATILMKHPSFSNVVPMEMLLLRWFLFLLFPSRYLSPLLLLSGNDRLSGRDVAQLQMCQTHVLAVISRFSLRLWVDRKWKNCSFPVKNLLLNTISYYFLGK